MRKKKADVVPIILSIVVAILFFFPLYMCVISAFKTDGEIARNILAPPTHFGFENFTEAAARIKFWTALKNSAIATFPSVLVITLFSAMGGYAIARNSKSNKFFAVMDRLYVTSLMLPFQIMMIPVYKMYKSLGLLNTLPGYMICLVGLSIAYPTFLYVGFVKSVPHELEESALIDGAGPYRAFISVVFPLLKPITMTVAALHVMWLWNDFNMALILLQKDIKRPLTVKQYYFFGQYTAQYGVAFSAAIMSMIPILVFFVAAQRYIVDGIAAGAVKS